MSDVRIFIESNLSDGLTLKIPDSELNHLKVRRVKDKDPILVLNGKGQEAQGILNLKRKEVKIVSVDTPYDRELKLKVNFILSIIRQEKLELAIQKLTELGVSSISLIKTKRSQFNVTANKMKRLKKIIVEALKQSGRVVLPELTIINSLDEIKSYKQGIVLWERSENPLTEIINKIAENKINCITVVIGPEGGFEDEEIKALKSMGFIDVSIGKVILRAETSAIYIASILRYISGQ